MKVIGLNGRTVPWNFSGCSVLDDDKTKKSKLHLRARKLLRDVFPFSQLLEEVPIPGSRLRADFVLPSIPLMVEVQGRQHYERTYHFQGSPEGFRRAVENDARKSEFCEKNGIKLVTLRYDETDEQWRAVLKSSR